jgi:hypothetical protein
MDEVPHIHIKLQFRSARGVPASVVARILAIAEEEALRVESEDIEELASEIRELPHVAIDAARYRIQQYRGKCFHITSAGQGSIILLGAVAGISYFVLDHTIGDTLGDAWRGSELHRRVLAFLREPIRFRNKYLRLGTYVYRRIGRDAKLRGPTVLLHTTSTRDGVEVVYVITPAEEDKESPQ